MAYNFLEETDLSDALHDSEEYMKDFYGAIPEIQRLTRGKPGKVPKGKPRITEGGLAAMRREIPKQIIQQLPSGTCVIEDDDQTMNLVNGVLSDVIIKNANSGGTPYAKAKRGIKSTVDVGSAWAYCFFNRTGSVWHADYKLKHYGDILFEKGKISEFDTNYMPMVEWLTEGDIKAIIYTEKQRKLTKTDWNLQALQELLDKGPGEKDQVSQDPTARKANAANGYFKLVYFFQKGLGATFYIYAPTIKKTLRTWTTKDPRGVIPIHGLIPEDDDETPLGEPLAAISAGKQNLLDFDLQMYQYGQGLQYSPPTKKWGQTPASRIKLIPDNVIEMDGTPATDDFKAVDLGNNATANFANNYGLLKGAIQAEMGRRGDTSISASAGAPGFSRTAAGVKQGQAVTDESNNDLMRCYELWQGRIFETCLNIQFSESKGKKKVPFEASTTKRYKLEDNQTVDYDKDYGKIGYKVEASSSKASNSDSENEKLINLLDIKSKYPNPDDKVMLMYNQIVRNAGVDDPEKLLYTEDEIQQAQDMRLQQVQLAHEGIMNQLKQAAAPPPDPAAAQPAPPQPKSLGESIAWKPGDLSPFERKQALAQVGVEADSDGTDTPNAMAIKTDAALQIDKHAHDTALQLSDHVMKHTAPEPNDAENVKEQVGEPANV